MPQYLQYTCITCLLKTLEYTLIRSLKHFLTINIPELCFNYINSNKIY